MVGNFNKTSTFAIFSAGLPVVQGYSRANRCSNKGIVPEKTGTLRAPGWQLRDDPQMWLSSTMTDHHAAPVTLARDQHVLLPFPHPPADGASFVGQENSSGMSASEANRASAWWRTQLENDANDPFLPLALVSGHTLPSRSHRLTALRFIF